MIETLIYLVIVLIVIGIVLWAVNAFIPMDPRIRTLITIVVIGAALIFALYTLVGIAPR